MTAPLLERFLSKVRRPVDASGCWIWIGYKDRNGYGRLGIGQRTQGTRAAYRVAYELFVDLIPEGMHVLHKCDNPACVNPRHLFLGTHADNMADAKAKGRSVRGASHYLAKLDPGQVSAIRRAVLSGEQQRAVARRYGVNHRTVWDIIHGRTWAHLTAPVP